MNQPQGRNFIVKPRVEKVGLNTLVRGRLGSYFANEHDMWLGRALILYGEFSWFEFDFMRRFIEPGKFVVEVGANIGAHTVGLARVVGPTGRVMAFEPQPVIHQTLCANMVMNGLHHVDCLPMGLGSQAETMAYPFVNYAKPGSFGSISLEKAKEAAKQGGLPVHIARLDDIYPFPQLEMMKIDVEGMETEVLKGAEKLIAKHRPVLYLENDRPEKSKELIETLWGMEYRLWWHCPPLFNPDNYFNYRENIYGKMASFNLLALPLGGQAAPRGMTAVTDSTFHPLRKVEVEPAD